MKILVVEDESYSRDSLVVQLKACDTLNDLQIFEAENGKVGLKIFKEEMPDLVLSDINMPLLNGIELLKKAIEVNNDAVFIMISGYADFKYAQEALNCGAKAYLLKPIMQEDLLLVIQKHLPLKSVIKNIEQVAEKDDTLNKYIDSIISSEDVIYNPIKDIVFNKIFSQFTFAVFFFDASTIPTKDELNDYVKRTGISFTLPDYRIATINQRSYGFIIKGQLKVEDFVVKLCITIARFNKNCRVGISNMHTGVTQLKEACDEATKAVSNKFFYSSQILFYDKVSSEHNTKYTPSENDLQLFDLWLKKADEQNAIKVLTKIITTMDMQGNLAISGYEHTFSRLKSIMYDNATLCNYESFAIHEDKFRIIDFNSSDELIAELSTTISRLCKEMEELRNPDNIATSLRRYVEMNYNKEISLKHLAENVFFLNVTYLSHLFSEKVGITYSAYLKQVRIARAKEALQQSDLTITDVAGLCGYNDVSQFIHAFKSEAGITPKKFRLTESERDNKPGKQ